MGYSDHHFVVQQRELRVPGLLLQPSQRLLTNQQVISLRMVLLDPFQDQVGQDCSHVRLASNRLSRLCTEKRDDDV